MKSYSERLKTIREEREMNQTAFAAIGGVGKSAQINYEKGERKPDIEYLANIAKIGCDVQYIITGEPSTEKLTQDETKLLELFRNADLAIKAAAMAVLESGEATSSRVIKNEGDYFERGHKIVGKNE